MRRVFWAALSLSALALAACPSTPGDGSGGAGGATPPAWQVVFDQGTLDRALLSVWGTSSKSVYVVGGPLGNDGRESLVMHFDGSSFRDLHVGGAETFWWVGGTSDQDVWMVGEKGRITHYDGKSFQESSSGVTATLWGVHAFSKNDVWAVGGTPGGAANEEDDIVLHFDGTAWSHVALPGQPLHASLFKVWGTSSDDLYVVGEAATVWHKTGPDWVLESNPPLAKGTLFTVWGCRADEVYAVGGRDILRRDAAGWSRVDVPLTNGVNGVTCGVSHNVAAVGFGGLKRRQVDGQWLDDFTKSPHGDLHAVWADETGAFWAVGGDFVSPPKAGQPRNGMVARYGPGHISTQLR